MQMTRAEEIPSRLLLLTATSQRNIAAAAAAGNGQQPEQRRSPARRRQHGGEARPPSLSIHFHSRSSLSEGQPPSSLPSGAVSFLFLLIFSRNAAPLTVDREEGQRKGPRRNEWPPPVASKHVRRTHAKPKAPPLEVNPPRSCRTDLDTRNSATGTRRAAEE
ncbi:hypothetical protein MRX96_023191 [Rhipicephalus microplus]